LLLPQFTRPLHIVNFLQVLKENISVVNDSVFRSSLFFVSLTCQHVHSWEINPQWNINPQYWLYAIAAEEQYSK
jgi:hypothetical protein